ncbi:MAG: aromatic ring-hydroxylating dioxygenase subunit alpha [Rhodospirillaceae bacterium]|nr:aromatic ring-hydroxylating dioxygenase subunit alpha [Rhodospirillaceae bacterium]
MFIRNGWYVAATATEVGRSLLARRICGEPVVLFRKEDGTPVAMEDRCPHRKTQLSLGSLVGDEVQCLYHGLRFDCDGACTFIPGQDNIPPRLRARVYPLVEKHTWLWLWPGDPALADPETIPDYHWNDAPGWTPVGGYLNFRADYRLLVDNLLDLTHETYVHARTIGNMAVAHTPQKTETEGDVVRVTRIMKDCDPPPLFRRARNFTGNIDRWQKIDFEPPAHIRIDAGGAAVSPADAGKVLNWWILNALTPETADSTHYFWTVSRNFSQDDAELSELVRRQTVQTFEEDRAVLESQQRMIETDPAGGGLLAINCDAGGVAARRIIDARLRAEAP